MWAGASGRHCPCVEDLVRGIKDSRHHCMLPGCLQRMSSSRALPGVWCLLAGLCTHLEKARSPMWSSSWGGGSWMVSSST